MSLCPVPSKFNVSATEVSFVGLVLVDFLFDIKLLLRVGLVPLGFFIKVLL
jgi:hypothetical protein